MELEGLTEAGSGAAYQYRLRQRFFVDNDNVAKKSVQLEVAEELGFPVDAVASRLDDGTALSALWEDHLEKERLMIQGSPTYVFDGGRAKLYGNFAYGILHATVEELVRGVRPGASAC
jgi:predicted DsbA family dithiol-disulfide isomerase